MGSPQAAPRPADSLLASCYTKLEWMLNYCSQSMAQSTVMPCRALFANVFDEMEPRLLAKRPYPTGGGNSSLRLTSKQTSSSKAGSAAEISRSDHVGPFTQSSMSSFS